VFVPEVEIGWNGRTRFGVADRAVAVFQAWGCRGFWNGWTRRGCNTCHTDRVFDSAFDHSASANLEYATAGSWSGNDEAIAGFAELHEREQYIPRDSVVQAGLVEVEGEVLWTGEGVAVQV
jgi:hypothetical protein